MTAPEPAVGEVAGPTACQTCGGYGVVLDAANQTEPCPDCRCVSCGQPCTTGLCRTCDLADMDARDRRRERAR